MQSGGNNHYKISVKDIFSWWKWFTNCFKSLAASSYHCLFYGSWRGTSKCELVRTPMLVWDEDKTRKLCRHWDTLSFRSGQTVESSTLKLVVINVNSIVFTQSSPGLWWVTHAYNRVVSHTCWHVDDDTFSAYTMSWLTSLLLYHKNIF